MEVPPTQQQPVHIHIELWVHVFSFLRDLRSLCGAYQVCKHFKEALQCKDTFWESGKTDKDESVLLWEKIKAIEGSTAREKLILQSKLQKHVGDNFKSGRFDRVVLEPISRVKYGQLWKVAADGNRIACTGGRGFLSLWDFTSHAHITDVKLSDNWIRQLRMQDGRILVGCSDRLVILDAQKGDIISDWPSAYTDELKCVDWRGDTILTCGTLSTDNVIRLWRIGQTQYVKQFTPSLAVDGVGSCHFDNSTKKMISTICSNILVFDIDSGTEEAIIPVNENIKRRQLVPNKEGLIVLALGDGSLQLWNYLTGSVVAKILNMDEDFYFCTWEVSSEYLLMGGEEEETGEGILWAYNLSTLKLEYSVKHPRYIDGADCDHRVLVSVDGGLRDPRVRVWDIKSGNMWVDISDTYPHPVAAEEEARRIQQELEEKEAKKQQEEKEKAEKAARGEKEEQEEKKQEKDDKDDEDDEEEDDDDDDDDDEDEGEKVIQSCLMSVRVYQDKVISCGWDGTVRVWDFGAGWNPSNM